MKEITPVEKTVFLHSKSYLFTVISFAVIGLTAALQLMMEKIELWKNPNYIPTCSWNPLFSCQGPMSSWQSGVFWGIPNPLIGIVAFVVLIVVSTTALNVKLPKWYWGLWLAGITAGWLFAMWLMTQSLYDIKALCIYCMVVWAMVIPLFWITLTTFVKSYSNKKWTQYFYGARYAFIILNYGAIILMIYVQFSDFFNLILF